MHKGNLAVVGHIGPALTGNAMSAPHALAALAALGQQTRLEIFRLLMGAEPERPVGRRHRRENRLSAQYAVVAPEHSCPLRPDTRRPRRPLDHLPRRCGRHPDPDRLSCHRLLPRSSGALRSAGCDHRGGLLPSGREEQKAEDLTMSETSEKKVYNVLFLCTGNSARSIMAEAILNRAGQGNFRAFSAGSHPKGKVHPNTLALLRKLHYDVSGARSKSWLEFSQPDSPKLDFVFTVCDNAAGEACPYWPGQPMTAHWGVPDPAAAKGPRRKSALPLPTRCGCWRTASISSSACRSESSIA